MPKFSLSTQDDMQSVSSLKSAPLRQVSSSPLDQIDQYIIQTPAFFIPWNWPVPSLGTMSSGQWNFCDFIPLSLEEGPMETSSDSFSENFSTFIQTLDESRFIPQNTLRNTLSINVPPNGKPKEGWTKVNFVNSVNSYRRNYTVSMYPYDWVNSVQASNDLSPLSFTIDDAKVLVNTNGSGNGKEVGNQCKITAEKWGIINIYPSDWFNSAILSLAQRKDGPYQAGFTNNDFFDDNGLIRGRIAAFIVALDPVLEMPIKKDDSSVIESLVDAGITGISCLGLTFGKDSGQSILSDFNKTMDQEGNEFIKTSSVNSSEDPYIIAVCVERL